MGFTCNINRRGRRVRAVSGVLCVTAGVAGLVRGWPPVGWGWLLPGMLIAIGVFQIFEAAAGWCAVRAMGLRTPL